MLKKIECANVYKNEDLKERKKEFTRKWIELLNINKKNGKRVIKIND